MGHEPSACAACCCTGAAVRCPTWMCRSSATSRICPRYSERPMFVGHYGVSFAIKRASPTTSLGTLFLAVQLLDVLFSIFLLVGLEKLRIVPGFTEYNPY